VAPAPGMVGATLAVALVPLDNVNFSGTFG